MTAVLLFAVVLLIAVLISGIAHRSVLSTAVLFLVAGIVAGSAGLRVIEMQPDSAGLERFVSFTLFIVLFTDGMRVGVRELRSAWRLPGRALLLGLPLTLVGNAVACRLLTGLSWLESFLVGAVLAPTDPVFASAIVGREEVPQRVRFLLNVESGLNDGLALPVVVALLASLSAQSTGWIPLGGQLVSGVALGIAVPAVSILIERQRMFGAAHAYEPLHALAIGLLVFGLASVLHVNEFLAAFAGGITVASLSPRVRNSFQGLGEVLAELFKLAALLVFGLLVSSEWAFGTVFDAATWAFTVVVLLVVRPLALLIALAGSKLGKREWITAAWFGPKGFASVVYGLLVLHSGIPDAHAMYHVIAIVVAVSIVAHSSTDVLIARRFCATPECKEPADARDEEPPPPRAESAQVEQG